MSGSNAIFDAGRQEHENRSKTIICAKSSQCCCELSHRPRTVNYRSHFQDTIIQIQRQLDTAMMAAEWGKYLELRHKMIAIKEHIIAHEAKCGYECDCEPDTAWLDRDC